MSVNARGRKRKQENWHLPDALKIKGMKKKMDNNQLDDYGSDSPNASSSDEEDFSNLDQNNVYHCLKFKLEQYKNNSDMMLQLKTKVEKYKNDRQEILKKKRGVGIM